MFERHARRDRSVYPAKLDQSEAALFKPTRAEFARTLKLHLLVSDHIAVGTSNVFESEDLRKLLHAHPELLSSGFGTLDLRDGCSSFADVLQSYRERSRKRESVYQTPEADEIARFLDREVTVVRRFAADEMQETFRSTLLESLRNPRSLVRQRLTAVSRAALDEMQSRIADMGAVGRSDLHALAREVIPHRVKAFMKEVNLAYYTIGSMRQDLALLLDERYVDDITVSVKSANEVARSMDADAAAFRTLMRKMQYDAGMLDELSIDLLIGFRARNRKSLDEFRDRWWMLRAEAAASAASAAELAEHFHDLLQAALDRERRVMRRVEGTSRGVQIMSLATGVAPLLATGSILSALGIVLAVLGFQPAFDRAGRAVVKRPLTVIADQLRAEALSSGTKALRSRT